MRTSLHPEKRPSAAVFLPLLLFLYILFIFSWSIKPGGVSSSESSSVLLFLQQSLSALGLPAALLTEHLVRKLAHFTEYAGLGILLFLCAHFSASEIFLCRRHTKLQGRSYYFLLPLVPCIDECIQRFSPGRSASPLDVLLDMAGAVFSVFLMYTGFHLFTKPKKGNCAAV